MRDGEISLLQWNIWYKEDIDRVLYYLQHMPGGVPDVLCLQELTDGYPPQQSVNTWEYLAQSLGYNYRVDAIPVITPDRRWKQAVGVLSRFDILSEFVTKLHTPEDPESMSDQFRSYIETTVATPAGELTFSTAHMATGDPQAETLPKKLEVARLTDLIATDPTTTDLITADSTGRKRYCFAGDTNAGPGSAIIRALDEHLVHAGPDIRQATCSTQHTQSDGPAHTLTERLSNRFDFIYHSRDIHTIFAKILDAEILGKEVSDHLPILAHLRLPDAEKLLNRKIFLPRREVAKV